jgi:hypothetical protein
MRYKKWKRVVIFQLFDFEVEVQPVLDVLVGKTVEQALIEVLEEEELEGLRVQQRRFRELRASEKAEELRIEKQDRKLREDKVTKSPQSPALKCSLLRGRFRV